MLGKGQPACRPAHTSDESPDNIEAGLDKGPPQNVVGHAGKVQGLKVPQAPAVVEHQLLRHHVYGQPHCSTSSRSFSYVCALPVCSWNLAFASW